MDAAKIHSSVIDVIGELISKNLPFSAFDVTKILRKRNIDVYHSQIKKEVSDYYASGLISYNYYRELNTLVNGRTTWVYYPDTFDPNNYDEDSLPDALDISTVKASYTIDGGITTVTQLPNPVPIIVKTTSNDYCVDGRGRLCIPAYMIRLINKTPGEKIYVKQSNGKVHIGNVDYIDVGTISFPYLVDKSNNVRISKYVLEYFGFDSTIYKLTIDGDILIEEK
jgi:hypothetical protein